MWAPLEINRFVFMKESRENGIDFYVSDLVRIWMGTMSNEEIVEIVKKMNPLIEASDAKLTEKVLSLLNNIKLANKRIVENNSSLTLYISSDIGGVKFNFQVKLHLKNPDLLFKYLVLPLIVGAAKLQIRENLLITLLKKKDAEIAEYKNENISIKRSCLMTKEFNMDDLNEEEGKNEVLALVINNPSLLYNFVNSDLLSMPTSPNELTDKETNNILDKSSECMFNVGCAKAIVNNKNGKTEKADVKSRKTKRLDVKLNPGLRRRVQGDYYNLKL